mmetsp:Transcript_60497/g.100421  ORF Transcript_60497/g.100421 Transcript_60497/m.100421 type:complete len:206 (+) Transcript_60497:1197-1814(+)
MIPLGMRMRIMNFPGVRLSRCTSPTHLSRVLKSAFSTSSQSISPERMAAAYSYTELKMVVASLASFAFSMGLPSAARLIASSGRNDVPVAPSHFLSGCARGRCAEKGLPSGETVSGVPVSIKASSEVLEMSSVVSEASTSWSQVAHTKPNGGGHSTGTIKTGRDVLEAAPSLAEEWVTVRFKSTAPLTICRFSAAMQATSCKKPI